MEEWGKRLIRGPPLRNEREGWDTRSPHFTNAAVNACNRDVSPIDKPGGRVTSGWPTNHSESLCALRTPAAPETQSFVDCCRRPNQRPASRSAVQLCK